METTQAYNPDMAYDLRQRYAKIVGDHMEDVAIFRKDKDYPNYFRALEDLHTITKHKYKKKLKNDSKKGYDDYRKEVIRVSNAYPFAWGGQGNVPNEVAQVEKALRDLEEYVYRKMHEANMFGAKRETEGLI